MSDKVRTINFPTGSMLATTNIRSGGGSDGEISVTLIGAPTLISSTFTAATIQSLSPTLTTNSISYTARVSENSPLIDPPALSSALLTLACNQQHSGGSDTESSQEFPSGVGMAQLNFDLLRDLNEEVGNEGAGESGGATVSASGRGGGSDGLISVGQLISERNSVMNSSQISAALSDSISLATPNALKFGDRLNGKHLNAQNVAGKSCRFPKLEECAHFHYERVQLGPLDVRLIDEKSEFLTSSIASQSIGGDIANCQGASGIGGISATYCRSFSPSSCWFIIKVMPHQSDPFLIRRSFDNLKMLDEMLHRCVYDRKISGLRNLTDLDFKGEEDVEYAVAKYLERFSKIASDSLTCGTILTWFQLDNKGRRLPLADGDTMRSINTPAVGAAYGVRRYTAQASDEISIEVGDMISVIDMPNPAESIWWRGKKSHLQKSHYEVGFFPQSCVATIGDKVPRHFPMPAPLVGQLDVSPTKPVLRKHGKLIAFFRSFILSRPSRRRLKQSGIYRERVFSCDLSEHLLNSGQEIPMVLKCCAEFLEDYGIVDGIYRLSGITSNIQRLRRAFDEERIPDLGNPELRQDIHAVSSLLKMYFRELPNPLCTYQLYDNFVEAIQEKSESNERLRLMKETVLKLPPPHYRTLKYLSSHLNCISQYSTRTGMTDKNLAIVWAPNLLRSPALESGGVAALRGVGVQAVVTEYLIRNCHLIFDALDGTSNVRLSYLATPGASTSGNLGATPESRLDSLMDCERLLVEQREHDQSLTFVTERPKSLTASGPKLISLEEAQERHSRLDGYDMNKSLPVSMVGNNATSNIGSYIEVGGGPSSLPDKYHTVLPVPRSWQKRKTHSWKSLFSRNQRTPPGGNTSGNNGMKSFLSTSGPKNIMPSSNCKEMTQVTFAESDSTIARGSNNKFSKSLHKHHGKAKSTELYETIRGDAISKPIEICVRSNSIDSLRTAGHSRSVSHDSYFDLLQSPQRGHVATSCPSRELSELGLNFDREEPEMRIFSESESLVSSPHVGKENIPPTSTSTSASRRILRARPEEFSSNQINSVNPSPKKQPRLNLLLIPNLIAKQQNWSSSKAVTSTSTEECDEPISQHTLSSDESCSKRYKLEDQLSDIQFIDCSTPEHTIGVDSSAQLQTHTNAQTHDPPISDQSCSSSASESVVKSLSDNGLSALTLTETRGTNNTTGTKKIVFETIFDRGPSDCKSTRYSYPTVQLGAKRKENETTLGCNERFSYPGSNQKQPPKEEMYNEIQLYSRRAMIDNSHDMRNTPVTQQKIPQSLQHSYHQHLPKPMPELPCPRNRYSYCDASDSYNNRQRHSAVTQHQLNLLLMRSNSSEIVKPLVKVQQQHNDLLDRLRTNATELTPLSPPAQSPRYSLLVGGDTSSENSSIVNTPQYDLEPLMTNSNISVISDISVFSGPGSPSHKDKALQKHHFSTVCSADILGNSRDSLKVNNVSISPDRRNMHALKRELSLDLKAANSSSTISSTSKICVNCTDEFLTLPTRLQHQFQHQVIPSPNNSNFTDNTSQSATPSDYGYQQLQRQSSVHSSSFLETTENSPNYENTPSNIISPLSSEGGEMTAMLLTDKQSPIKSTISITYNLKSPQHEGIGNVLVDMLPERPPRTLKHPKPLLETSFDEHIVYEQVKLFRDSVTEVNQLLNGNSLKSVSDLRNLNKKRMEGHEHGDRGKCEGSVISETYEHKSKNCIYFVVKANELPHSEGHDNNGDDVKRELIQSTEDVYMQQTINDRLDAFSPSSSGDEHFLYENVELRKPRRVYENMNGEDMKTAIAEHTIASVVMPDDGKGEKLELELECLETTKLCDVEFLKGELTINGQSSGILSFSAKKSPSNFSVKELANKFESSPPLERPQVFDFNMRGSVKKHPQQRVATTSERFGHDNRANSNTFRLPSAAASLKRNSIKEKTLNKTQQITRSLDENAFVQEFGTKSYLGLTTKSTQQLPEYSVKQEGSSTLLISSRRKSYDFTRPKTLNQPKRLPGMRISEEICMKPSHKAQKPTEKSLKLDLQRDQDSSSPPGHDFESAELEITPTTENRISLIQNNVGVVLSSLADQNLSNSNSNLSSLNSLKVLSGVKLDRERIDKIKEERRQQLTQKYHTHSFKSQSKNDLNTLQKDDDVHVDALRTKSKSRTDMRAVSKDVDNLRDFGRSVMNSAISVSETTLHQQNPGQKQRVRSTSNEKNQNCEAPSDTTTNKSTITSVKSIKATSYDTATFVASNSASTTSSSDSSNSDDYAKRISFKQQRAIADEYSARATAQKFERRSLDSDIGSTGSTGGDRTYSGVRERRVTDACSGNSLRSSSKKNLSSTREKISPQFSIRDVTAMFESRSQNQQ